MFSLSYSIMVDDSKAFTPVSKVSTTLSNLPRLVSISLSAWRCWIQYLLRLRRQLYSLVLLDNVFYNRRWPSRRVAQLASSGDCMFSARCRRSDP